MNVTAHIVCNRRPIFTGQRSETYFKSLYISPLLFMIKKIKQLRHFYIFNLSLSDAIVSYDTITFDLLEAPEKNFFVNNFFLQNKNERI